MANDNITPTGEYYVFDKETDEKVCAFEDAPATLWDGLLDRMTGTDGYIASADELHQLTYWPELERGYEVRQRYIDRHGKTAEYRREIYNGAPVADPYWKRELGQTTTLGMMLMHAGKEQRKRVQADNRRRAARQAFDHADRYQQGLADLDAFEARGKLRDRILSISDREIQAEWMGRYPELFDTVAADQLAEADRKTERAEAYRTVGGEPIRFAPVE